MGTNDNWFLFVYAYVDYLPKQIGTQELKQGEKLKCGIFI